MTNIISMSVVNENFAKYTDRKISNDWNYINVW